MDSLNLSPRLAMVARFVTPGARIADIGSDHGYLPAHLLLNQNITYAVIGEVASGPLENAKHELDRRHLTAYTQVRLANGLAAILPEDNVTEVTIAGMGGILISEILSAGYQRHQKFEKLILQPNTDEQVLRTWLEQHHYQITAEDIVQEGKHFYEVIVAQPGEQVLSETDRLFGPLLRKQQAPAFFAKWQKELQRIETIFDNLAAADKVETSAYQDWHIRYTQIQEVLS